MQEENRKAGLLQTKRSDMIHGKHENELEIHGPKLMSQKLGLIGGQNNEGRAIPPITPSWGP